MVGTIREQSFIGQLKNWNFKKQWVLQIILLSQMDTFLYHKRAFLVFSCGPLLIDFWEQCDNFPHEMHCRIVILRTLVSSTKLVEG